MDFKIDPAIDFFAEVLCTLDVKGDEYGREEAKDSVTLGASALGMSEAEYLCVLMQKHLTQIYRIAKGAEPTLESVRSRLIDAAAYLALLESVFTAQQRNAAPRDTQMRGAYEDFTQAFQEMIGSNITQVREESDKNQQEERDSEDPRTKRNFQRKSLNSLTNCSGPETGK